MSAVGAERAPAHRCVPLVFLPLPTLRLLRLPRLRFLLPQSTPALSPHPWLLFLLRTSRALWALSFSACPVVNLSLSPPPPFSFSLPFTFFVSLHIFFLSPAIPFTFLLLSFARAQSLCPLPTHAARRSLILVFFLSSRLIVVGQPLRAVHGQQSATASRGAAQHSQARLALLSGNRHNRVAPLPELPPLPPPPPLVGEEADTMADVSAGPCFCLSVCVFCVRVCVSLFGLAPSLCLSPFRSLAASRARARCLSCFLSLLISLSYIE